MSRKSTPDVLGDIMGSHKKDNKEIKQQSNKTLTQEVPKKEKTTFNLSVEALDQLEEVWVKLRKEKRGTRITKTLIVETAIRMAIGGYESGGERSDLFKNL